MGVKKKVSGLSSGLQEKIIFNEREYVPDVATPVTNFLVKTKLHCNAGKVTEAGFFLKQHCDDGGTIFVSMSGAGSTFQMGKTLAKLISEGKVGGLSVTGANLEESLYRYIAFSEYAYIPRYAELTKHEEQELAEAGLRRITDTFLPEDESVRIILPKMRKLWEKAQREGKSYFWHEYFFQLFEHNLIKADPATSAEDCWLYQAWKHKVPVYVPGAEDSTMGNIFAQLCYKGKDKFLSKYKEKKPLSLSIIKHSFEYMHHLAETYMKIATKRAVAHLQLGGGIAADFWICVIPHLKKDYLWRKPIKFQAKTIPALKGFIEVSSAPTSQGSYTGAGGNEKITWEKLNTESFSLRIDADYTTVLPDLAAIILGW